MQPDKSTKVNFANQLSLLCQHHGLRQKDIAEICGVSAAAVNKWFKGGDMKVEYAVILARRFEISIESLAGLEPVAYEISRRDSESRIRESAAPYEGGEDIDQIVFERNLMKKHLRDSEEKRLKARKKISKIRDQLDKLMDEL